MKKHEHIFKSYKRNHKEQNFEDAEKMKIGKEKSQVKSFEKRARKLLKQVDLEKDYDNKLDEIDTISFESRKVAKNLNTHQNRLKELQKNKEFE